MKPRVQRVHFVGIGGAGMSGIAEILQKGGYSISGSDLRSSSVTERLSSLGIRIEVGHDANHVGRADVVVYSSAVSPRNPELRVAEAARIPVISRAEMLAELMRMKYGVAIAGSHGKTTTTSMVGDVLMAGGLDPTIIVGGRVKSLGSNSYFGSGDLLVAEADESDGSFLSLIPTNVVLTNIDREHLDHYESLDRLKQAFLDFVNRVPFWGSSSVCLDDPNIQEILPEITRRTRTFGLAAQAEISAAQIERRGLETRFAVIADGRDMGEISLKVPGLHNVTNSLAAVAVGIEFGVPFPQIRDALASFDGVERRFEIRGQCDGVVVVDDYAHHPTEIRATLDAARQAFEGRILVAFQPHRYTRTRDVFDELARCFHDADTLIVTEIYPAGEPKIPGVEGRSLADAAREWGHRSVEFVADAAEIITRLRELTREGDAVLFLGAGDIGRLATDFLAGGATE